MTTDCGVGVLALLDHAIASSEGMTRTSFHRTRAKQIRDSVAELIAQRDAAIEGIEKALEEVADDGPKALKHVEQELRTTLASLAGASQ